MSRRWAAAVAAAVLALGGAAHAQRGNANAPPPATGRAGAPVDLTGNWVSMVTQDWRWRMVMPPKGDYRGIPMTPEALKLAQAWDPAKDEAAGEQCRSYGAPALMSVPGRVRISWQDDQTLKIETDAGQQTRLLRFGAPAASGPRTLQGHSAAEWQLPPGGAANAPGAAASTGAGSPRQQPRAGSLKVVTTNLLAGWLRKNGVPYSENAVLTEYFDRFTDGTSEWFAVTTIVEDPANLTMPFIISSNFKKEPDGSRWAPAPCKVS